MSVGKDRERKRESGEEAGRAVGTGALLLGSKGDTEIELQSSPEGRLSGRTEAGRCPSPPRPTRVARERPSPRGEALPLEGSGLAVSWFGPGMSPKPCILLLSFCPC